jgi:hypothetical protein
MRRSTMKHIGQRFLWIAAYAIAMALLEAVVVVYLRGLLQITNENVALGEYQRIEMWREVATLVMLAAVGWIAGRRGLERLAYGVFAFGLWDIWYYVWLKAFTGWPETLLNWDVLFLIPLRWWGPVISPVLIAMLVCVVAVLAVIRLERGQGVQLTPGRVATTLLGGLLALYVFMADALGALIQGRSDWDTLRPSSFNWPLFLLALALMAWPSLRAVWPERRLRTQAQMESA